MLLEKDSFNNNTATMSKSVIDFWIKILCNHQMIRIESKHFICDYTHLRSTIAGPASSYSPFVIRRDWKVSKDAKIDPPIHADNLRSVGGAMILTFSAGAREVISFWIRSAIPWNIVDPPVRTMLAHSSLRVSSSHFMIELYVVSWIPADSTPRKKGWNMVSGHRNLSFPMVMTRPSGSSYVFCKLELDSALLISCSKSRAT